MKISFLEPARLTQIIAITIIFGFFPSLNSMEMKNFGEIRGVTDGDKKAYQLYLNYEEPLAISQSPFNCDKYSEELSAESTPQIAALEEKIVKLVDATGESTLVSASESNSARLKEIEDQLKTAMPQELLDMLRKSAVMSSAQLPYINSDRYKGRFKVNFRMLMREVLVHTINAATQAGKVKETALKKKHEESKDEFASLALKEREQDAQIDALQKQLESMRAALNNKASAAKDPKRPDLIKEKNTDIEAPHEEQAKLQAQFAPLSEKNYQLPQLSNSAKEQERDTPIDASPKPLEMKMLLSSKASAAQDQKMPYPSYLHALLYGKPNNKK